MDGLGHIIDETDVKCQVKFGDKEKGIYDDAKESTYLVRFSSKSRLKIELAHMILMLEDIVSIYNNNANITYKNRLNKMCGSTESESGTVSDIGDSESEAESVFVSDDEDEKFLEETCEICGTRKGSRFPFEVTNCRNLDRSIVDSLINKMKGKATKTYHNFKKGEKKPNKEAFNNLINSFTDFIDKFIKWSKFCFSHELTLYEMMKVLTNVKNVSNYSFEQVVKLNNVLQDFINKLKSAPL